MQRHAYLIMAHSNWFILETLLRLIDAPWNDIYLHIDRKALCFDQKLFMSICKYSNLYFTKRCNITWGNETQVIAEITLFEMAFHNGPYHYYHFLSGADLPIKPKEEIYRFFEDKKCNYLHCIDDASPFEWRLEKYYNVFRGLNCSDVLRKRLNVYSEILQYKLNTNRLIWLKRHYPIIGKGHNWCDLTHNAVAALIRAKKHIHKFCRFTLCSDEMYKQIIILNQPSSIVGPLADIDIRLIDWSNGGDHPRVFTDADFNLLITAPDYCIFARKFDEAVDKKIIGHLFCHLSK